MFFGLQASLREYLTRPITQADIDEAAKLYAAPAKISTVYGASSSRDAGGFRIGQQVKHAKFGVSIIFSADGSGKNTQVEVNFFDHGIKRLALEFAKLVAV